MSIENFVFCLPIWGQDYVDRWLNYALPNSLSTGNLKDFPWASTSVFQVHTTTEDMVRMVRHPNYQKLVETIPTEWVSTDDLASHGKFGIYTECQRRSAEMCDDREGVLVFMAPDGLLSTGTLQNAARNIMAGKTAVMIAGNRGRLEDLEPWLDRNGPEIAPEALVKASVEFIHQNSASWFWGSDRFDKTPAYLMWPIPGAGYVVRAYILHPLMVNAQVRNAPFLHIFDQDYLEKACPDVSKIHIVSHSAEGFVLSLDPSNRFYDWLEPRRATTADVAFWGEWCFNDHHRTFAKTPIIQLFDKPEPGAFAYGITRSEVIVEQIQALFDRPDAELFVADQHRLGVRLRRRYRYLHKQLYHQPLVTADAQILVGMKHTMQIAGSMMDPLDQKVGKFLGENEIPDPQYTNEEEQIRSNEFWELYALLKSSPTRRSTLSVMSSPW